MGRQRPGRTESSVPRPAVLADSRCLCTVAPLLVYRRVDQLHTLMSAYVPDIKCLTISRHYFCHWAPPVYVTPANIHTNLILQESRLIDLHFVADSLRLASFNFFLVSSVRRFYFGIIGDGGVSAVEGHPRSINLVSIESAGSTSY